ncbi:terpenoid synthase [Dichomitus squalens]|uniref:Terpenoid synthase n=1 Tax=Dichomitus squalens TaxID=114155 RepID=A0A4Q9PQB0_9APHY|nr:terpenoid synthase [Dichomitus squalens]TBU56543.1 terpenoid synthase [Dichomitus squalens]
MFTLLNDPTFPSLSEEHKPFVNETVMEVCGVTRPLAVSKLRHNGDVDILGSDVDPIMPTKALVRDFLDRLPYTAPCVPADSELRHEVADLIASWNAGVSWKYIEGLAETSCSIAESAYAHTSHEHQRMVAIYTACLTLADDLGHHNMEALGQFVGRFTRGEPQLHPALDCLVKLLGTLHEFCPRINADAIIASTVDSVSAMYIEVLSQGDVISPFATKYPFYFRIKTGIAPAYAHLNFTKSWGDDIGTYYLQLLPEFELVVVGFNDILSFYKETLAGETDNYVNMRAAVEQKQAISVLRQLIEENLDSVYKLRQLAAPQPGLTEIFLGFLMGYVEFHFKARRYRLHEIIAEVDEQ